MADKEAAISMALKKAKIIGPIFGFVGPALYLVLAYLLLEGRSTVERDVSHLTVISYILYAETVINFLIAIFLYRKIPEFFIKYSLKPPSGIMAQFADYIPKPPFETVAHSLPIIIFAFLESCSLFGLLLFIMLGFDYEIMLTFVAFTVIGYLIVRPRREFFERLYEKIEKHKAGLMT